MNPAPVKVRWYLLAIPAAFALAALLSRALLQHAPLYIATDLSQPLPVATTWHGFGQSLWLSTFACIAAASVAYIFTLRAALKRKSSGLTVPAIVTFSAIALVAALSMPVVFSSDVYAYAAYGSLAAHGVSPYAHTAITVQDPLLRAAVWQWTNPLPACVYGPLFVWIAQLAVTATAAFGVAAQLFTLRLVSSAALLACAPLVFLAFRGFRTEQRVAVAAGIALNPVAIWSAAEGHNDALMLVAVLLGFIAVRKFGYFIGAFLIASSALIKASGAAAALILAMFAWPNRSRFVSVLGGFSAGIALTALVALSLESGVRNVLSPHGHYTPQFSAQYVLAQIAVSIFGTRWHAAEFGIAVAAVGAACIALYGVRLALAKNPLGTAYVALGVWLLIPTPYPWYALWILPVAFLSMKSAPSWAIVAATLTIFVRYLPDASSATNADLNLAITAFELGLPLALLAGYQLVANFRGAFEGDASTW